MTKQEMRQIVQQAVAQVRITDVHTHLFSPAFGELLLWNVDELLTYHYLIAETFRYVDLPYETFWAMNKTQQAELIFKTLFIDHIPFSEACRGVLTSLKTLGVDVSRRDLFAWRRYFEQLPVETYVDRVFEAAGVKQVVMTNDPFDPAEYTVWQNNPVIDPRFLTALRIDALLLNWPDSCQKLKGWGYNVGLSLEEETLGEIRRFLNDWIDRMKPLYMAASLPPTLTVPDDSPCSRIIEQALMPVGRERDIPFAMMVGVKKLTNPDLRLAGDSEGRSRIETIEYLCAHYPKNKFLLTMLSRENQHELTVAARKFRNLLVFGCWWFLNNPSIIEDMTRMRFEMLGASVVPQHSDARVLDQLLYKWPHSRAIIARVLVDKLEDLMDTGWVPTHEEIVREVEYLFGGAFFEFLGKKL